VFWKITHNNKIYIYIYIKDKYTYLYIFKKVFYFFINELKKKFLGKQEAKQSKCEKEDVAKKLKALIAVVIYIRNQIYFLVLN